VLTGKHYNVKLLWHFKIDQEICAIGYLNNDPE